jgi:uncharacterized protein (TIGR02186 family)
MKRSLIFFWLCALACPSMAATPQSITLANPMVADISQDAIEIRTSFNGAQLLIFGARNIPGDVVIAVRGPAANITLRRKERIAGMWMHVEQHKYAGIPLFYALAATKPLEEIAPYSTLKSLGLGEEEITNASHQKPHAIFDAALEERLSKKQWWQSPFNTITYFGESLFKARLDLPDSLPGGHYTAEIYLFDNGALRAMQIIPISVSKTGFEARLVESALRQSGLYGLIAVLMALLGGWLAHRLFHRR